MKLFRWKSRVCEIAHLKSDFLALKTELAEVKEQNKRYEKKLSELITYSIFHTKNTKAQEEICFIVRREAEKLFSYPSEQATDPGSSTVSTSATHTPTPSLPTTQTQVTSSPHIHQSPLHRSPMITSPPLSSPRHTFSTSRQPVRASVRIRNQHRSQSQSWWAAHLIKISSWFHTTISEVTICTKPNYRLSQKIIHRT